MKEKGRWASRPEGVALPGGSGGDKGVFSTEEHLSTHWLSHSLASKPGAEVRISGFGLLYSQSSLQPES